MIERDNFFCARGTRKIITQDERDVRMVQMLDFDRPTRDKGEFRFAALQSEVGRALLRRGGRKPDDISSIVLATEGVFNSVHAFPLEIRVVLQRVGQREVRRCLFVSWWPRQGFFAHAFRIPAGAGCEGKGEDCERGVTVPCVLELEWRYQVKLKETFV